MNTPIKHQIIEDNGQPLFVIVPYKEYLAMLDDGSDEDVVIPLAVSKSANMEGKSLVRAWREYKGLSQAEMAKRLSVSLPAYTQMEEKEANLRTTTKRRIAEALEVSWEQLQEEI